MINAIIVTNPGFEMLKVSLIIGAGILALVYAIFLSKIIMKESPGEKEMVDISKAIQEGAMAFLKREYLYLDITLFIIALFIIFFLDWTKALVFIFGALVAALTAWIGMSVSTRANSRCANLASKSFSRAFRVGFLSGAVISLTIVGVGILGIIFIWLITKNVEFLIFYAFGSSLVALFLRVGGGIYTKSADVGGDLVGKVEAGIPEDDPRNPAVIADAVGDNVGDVAGMGSDLFESYVSAVIAAMFLGMFISFDYGFLPLLLAAAGIICSIIGIFLVKIKEGENESFEIQTQKIRTAMNRGIIVANFLMIIFSFFIIHFFIGNLEVFFAVLAGVLAGVIIGWATVYFTSDKYPPVLSIAKSSESGSSTVIIEGLAQGLMSVVIPVIAIIAVIIIAYHYVGLFGIAIAGLGVLGVLGINLACGCYGPIVDNAAGIAQMRGMNKLVRSRCDALDAVGNSTAAMGRGFAAGSAVLVALAWFASYYEVAKIDVINIGDPKVIAGLFIGGLIVFLFSALIIKAVSRGAYYVVNEVRRQWKEIPGLMEGKARAEYVKCIDITTKESLKQMVAPGLLSVVVPVLVGIILGKEALGAVLVSSLVVGLLMALFMSNAGGAWDNAKKYIESGYFGGKGSLAHKAAVIGDTVGDPLKDASGPSLNILIKILGIVSLIIAPFL